MFVRISIAVVTCCLLAQAFAASSFEDRMGACASVADNTERLACFDREMKANRTAPAPAKAPAAARAATPSEAPTQEAAPAIAAQKKAPPKTITAKVVAVTRPTGRDLRIELDNGQVWRETDHNSEIELKPGDEVRVRAAALGSFLLHAPSGRSTRVHLEAK